MYKDYIMKNNLSENENKVLEYLKNHSLTTMQAVIDLHIINVQDCIIRLRRYGYSILKEWKYSGKKRYATYYLVNVL